MLESHLKFLTVITHPIYRILTLLEAIVWNKILFKFQGNKKQALFKKTNKFCLKKNKLLFFQIDSIN